MCTELRPCEAATRNPKLLVISQCERSTAHTHPPASPPILARSVSPPLSPSAQPTSTPLTLASCPPLILSSASGFLSARLSSLPSHSSLSMVQATWRAHTKKIGADSRHWSASREQPLRRHAASDAIASTRQAFCFVAASSMRRRVARAALHSEASGKRREGPHSTSPCRNTICRPLDLPSIREEAALRVVDSGKCIT